MRNRIVDITTKEICLDGTEIREFTFSEPVDETMIRDLSVFGNLEYFSHFPRPFYRVTRPSAFMIKGVEGTMTFQILFFRDPVLLCEEIRHSIEQDS